MEFLKKFQYDTSCALRIISAYLTGFLIIPIIAKNDFQIVGMDVKNTLFD